MLVLVILHCKNAHSFYSPIFDLWRAKELHLRNLETLESSVEL